MSEHALAQQQTANTPEAVVKDSFSLEHRERKQLEQTTLPELFSNSGISTFAEPRVGFDFSRVPALTGMERQLQPLLRTQPMVQRVPRDETAGSSLCPSCPEVVSTKVSAPIKPETAPTTETAGPMNETPGTETEPIPEPAEPDTESVSPGETSASALLVEDSAVDLAPGQMRKSEFLAQLRTEVTRTAEEAMAGTGRTTKDCPYLEYWFGFYSGKDSAHIERAIHKYAPETATTATARDYIPIIATRVRQSVELWARTGEITGVPEGLSMDLPGMGLLGSVGRMIFGIGSIFFKARAGGARKPDDPRAIQVELGEGRPLDSGVRSRMGSAFGMDFSRVRTHTDTTAAGLSTRMNARAFTVGEHVAFGAGEYKPGTIIGDALIAHELAHTIQQSGGTESAAQMKGGHPSYNNLEDDADKSAIGAVASLFGGAKDALSDIAQNAIPRLRSGLHLSRCSNEPRSESSSTTTTSTTPCKPTYKSLKAEKTGSIAMTTAWSGNCEMAFGIPGAPGMTFKSEVDAPSGCTGTLEYVQLIDRCLQQRNASGTNERLKTDGYALDTADPYPFGGSKKVTSPGTVKFQADDSPSGGYADSNVYLYCVDRFKMWLLWTPDNPSGSPRVPLAMVEWNWTAKATKKTPPVAGCAAAWTISDNSANGGTGSATTTMPNWSKTYPTDFSYKAGTC